MPIEGDLDLNIKVRSDIMRADSATKNPADDSDIVKIAMPASMPHAPQHTVRVHVWDPLPGLPEQQALLASSKLNAVWSHAALCASVRMFLKYA